MIISRNSLKTFSIFWILVGVYFLIPFFVESIPPPVWFYSLDSSIPFIWWMIIPYYFHYIFVIIPPFVIKDKLKLYYLTSILIKTTIICYLFYIIWPISAELVLNTVPNDNPLVFFHSSITFNFLHQNAFPSMHVVVSMIVAAVLADEYPNIKWALYLLGGSIFLATFLIKQHYVLDSIAGLIIAILGYISYRRSLVT